jgi:hypothetical protein
MLAGCKAGQPDERKTKIEKRRRHHKIQAGMCKTRLRRRFIHTCRCGCKVRVSPGSHHRPSCWGVGSGDALERTQQRRRRAANRGSPSGKPERVAHKGQSESREIRKDDSGSQPATQPKRQRTGVTRGATFGTAGRSRRSGATRNKLIRDVTDRAMETGKPEDSNTVAWKGEKFEATRRIHWPV